MRAPPHLPAEALQRFGVSENVSSHSRGLIVAHALVVRDDEVLCRNDVLPTRVRIGTCRARADTFLAGLYMSLPDCGATACGVAAVRRRIALRAEDERELGSPGTALGSECRVPIGQVVMDRGSDRVCGLMAAYQLIGSANPIMSRIVPMRHIHPQLATSCCNRASAEITYVIPLVPHFSEVAEVRL